MPLDPRLIADTPEKRSAERIAELERRVGAVERTPRIQFGEGAPTQAVRDGTQFVDKAANRLYVRSNGAWKSAALT
jgi:hypothetical protein